LATLFLAFFFVLYPAAAGFQSDFEFEHFPVFAHSLPMCKALRFLILLIIGSTSALFSTGCTPSGASTGAALSDGYQAPQSGSAVDQTESMRSQYRDWVR